jgi:tetratricopeptide (TPR) repeat protein
LRAIVDEPGLEASLAALTRLEFLREQGGAESPMYVFKHALTHDVAYSALAPGRRRDLHRRLGLAIEHLQTDRLAEHLEVLAHHFSNAEEWGKAFEYLRKSAEKAAGALAIREAIGFYDQALVAGARLEPGPDAQTLMAIYRARADLHSVLSDYGRARADRARALGLAREAGNLIDQGAALAGMGMASVWAHDFDQALLDAHAAIEVVESVEAKAVLAAAYTVTALVNEVTGRLDEAWADAERAVTLSRSVGDAANEAQTISVLGELRNFQGQYGEAVRLQAEALQIARAHGSTEILLWIFFSYGVALTGQGNYDQALTNLEEGLALSTKVGDEIWRHRLLNTLGWLYGEVGGVQRSRELSRQGAEEARKRGDPETIANAELNLADLFVAGGDLVLADELLVGVHRLVKNPVTSDWMKWRYSMHLFASLGDLWLARGDSSKAREFANQCLELATRTTSRKYLVKGWRLKGEIAIAHRQWSAAEAALREALTFAQAIGNPTQLWKTHAALGRLFAEAKRPLDAHRAYQAARVVIEHARANLTHPGLRAGWESAPLIRQVLELANPD